MHHFVFSHKDSFVYSEEVARKRNFGLDKFVEVGCVNKLSRTYRTASLAPSSLSAEFINRYVINFNGSFTGSICLASGSVSGSLNCNGYLSPGGICAPLGIVDEFGNLVIEDDGDFSALSFAEDFFVFP
jgi:hypothetical protein